MQVELDFEPNQDFENYLKFLRNRVYLTDSELQPVVFKVYKKIYMITTLSSSIDLINPRSQIADFFYECKNNIILSLDLCNFNYYNASKQILRSGIESFFRFCLALQHYIEYRENLKNRIFEATPLLKQLKSMQQSHSVGKLTNFIVCLFEGKSIESTIKELNQNYSILSGNVHVNKQENFTPQRFLSDYTQLDLPKNSDYLIHFESIIDCFIIILYYYSFKLEDENMYFKKKYITEFSQEISDISILEVIESAN